MVDESFGFDLGPCDMFRISDFVLRTSRTEQFWPFSRPKVPMLRCCHLVLTAAFLLAGGACKSTQAPQPAPVPSSTPAQRPTKSQGAATPKSIARQPSAAKPLAPIVAAAQKPSPTSPSLPQPSSAPAELPKSQPGAASAPEPVVSAPGIDPQAGNAEKAQVIAEEKPSASLAAEPSIPPASYPGSRAKVASSRARAFPVIPEMTVGDLTRIEKLETAKIPVGSVEPKQADSHTARIDAGNRTDQPSPPTWFNNQTGWFGAP